MRGVMLILEGLADEAWGGDPEATPLEAAQTPALDELATTGRVGLACLGDTELAYDSAVGLVAALGGELDREAGWPAGVVEAMGADLELAEEQAAGRLSLVTIEEGRIVDPIGGGLSDVEGAALYEALGPLLTNLMSGGGSAKVVHAGEARAVVTFDGGELEAIAERFGVPVLEAWRRPLKQLLDRRLDRAFTEAMEASAELIASHEVVRARTEMGETVPTHVWPWGLGLKTMQPRLEDMLPSLRKGEKLSCALVTAGGRAAGVGAWLGWEVFQAEPGVDMTDTAARALDDHAVVCVHDDRVRRRMLADDEAGMAEMIAAADRTLIGPLRGVLDSYDSWRMLVLPTSCLGPCRPEDSVGVVPWLMAGERVRSAVRRPFTMNAAWESDLTTTRGRELLEYFLFSGGVRPGLGTR
jgi:2,3-bisphosphoglycerate-independent phosphoglycerate mutase